MMGSTADGCAVAPPVESLYEAQQYVARRLQDKWLAQFTADPEFIARQSPDAVSIGHVVDDVIAARRRQNVQAIHRVSLSRVYIVNWVWVRHYERPPLTCFRRRKRTY